MNRKIRSLLTFILPKTPFTLVYMLQQVEYDPGQFLGWVGRFPDYRHIMRRKRLVLTGKAAALLFLNYVLYVAWLAVVVLLFANRAWPLLVFSFILGPVVILLLMTIVLSAVWPVLRAKRKTLLRHAAEKMETTRALKIAVMGSYGKTTVKEVLTTVLAQGLKTASTPGNKNVDVSLARWIMADLDGTEEIIIVEFGEYRPGDIANFCRLTKPDIAIVTGYAPNHLDTYGSEEALQADLRSVAEFVSAENIYVSEQAQSVLQFSDGVSVYASSGIGELQITKAETDFTETRMSIRNNAKSRIYTSGLLGEHLAPVIALSIHVAMSVGMSEDAVADAVTLTKPHQHRLKPSMVNGAWLIDDTYNGNIEGMRAGLKLLRSLPAKRRIYVTPGLVEQGSRTQDVHLELGSLIAKAQPDRVVLMSNSVTEFIQQGLTDAGYEGEVTIESNPLQFYERLPYSVAAGDVVLMQNDWTDNYN